MTESYRSALAGTFWYRPRGERDPTSLSPSAGESSACIGRDRGKEIGDDFVAGLVQVLLSPQLPGGVLAVREELDEDVLWATWTAEVLHTT